MPTDERHPVTNGRVTRTMADVAKMPRKDYLAARRREAEERTRQRLAERMAMTADERLAADAAEEDARRHWQVAMASKHHEGSWDPFTVAIRRSIVDRAKNTAPRTTRATRTTRHTTARRTAAMAGSAAGGDDGGGEPPDDPAPVGAEGRAPGGLFDFPRLSPEFIGLWDEVAAAGGFENHMRNLALVELPVSGDPLANIVRDALGEWGVS